MNASSVADPTRAMKRTGIFEMGGMERDDKGHASHPSILTLKHKAVQAALTWHERSH